MAWMPQTGQQREPTLGAVAFHTVVLCTYLRTAEDLAEKDHCFHYFHPPLEIRWD